MTRLQGLLIITIIVVVAALGAYYYQPEQQKRKLVVDFWYVSGGKFPQSEDQAVLYKTQLERTGVITVNLHAADWPSYKQNRLADSMAVFMGGWWPDYLDADNFIYPFFHSLAGGWLHIDYKNPEMDRLIDQARATSNSATRKQLYDQIQEIMVNDSPVVPIFQLDAVAVTESDVQGVVLDITQNMYYWMIESPRDTLIVGTTDSIGTNLDVVEAYDFFGESVVMNTGASLVSIKLGSAAGPQDFMPGLATSWSSSSDGLTWIFDLRQGVKFSDGTEFDANAVKYSFDRSMSLYLPDGPQAAVGYKDIIASVEVASKYQVVFRLKIPFAPFLSLMAFQGSFIVNPKLAPIDKAVNYVEGDARASNPNDLGPYRLSSWVRRAGRDYEIRYDANPNYWGASEGYPKTKHVIFKFYSDSTALALAIRSGDVDMAYRYLTVADLNSMQMDPSLKVWKSQGSWFQFLCFQEKIPPFDNPKVRQAIIAALDRKELVDTVFLGQAAPLYSMIPNGMTFHQDAYKRLGDANITFTISTLKELGYG
jgi:ABC-type transport system substrate-binding protein